MNYDLSPSLQIQTKYNYYELSLILKPSNTCSCKTTYSIIMN